MQQLSFDVTCYEKHVSKTNGNVYLLGSPEYEEQVQHAIKRIINNGGDKGGRTLDRIRGIPYALQADGIDINTDTQNTIEKKLLDKVGCIGLVACYRLLSGISI